MNMPADFKFVAKPNENININLPDGRIICGMRGATLEKYFQIMPEWEGSQIVGAVVLRAKPIIGHHPIAAFFGAKLNGRKPLDWLTGKARCFQLVAIAFKLAGIGTGGKGVGGQFCKADQLCAAGALCRRMTNRGHEQNGD